MNSDPCDCCYPATSCTPSVVTRLMSNAEFPCVRCGKPTTVFLPDACGVWEAVCGACEAGSAVDTPVVAEPARE